MKEFLKLLLEKIVPSKYQIGLRYIIYKKTNKLDPEMFYISKLLKNKRRFLDIGANIGIYTYHFKNTFKNIDAFEPLEEITYGLKEIQNEFLKIHNVALSKEIGQLKFYIPYLNGKICTPLASLEKRDGEFEVRTMNVNTVDNYNFDDVDLIKIDVEGHEQSVIEGAIKTIKKTLPILIIEIEQRHIEQKIDKVFQSILIHNYNGFFLEKGVLTPLKEFSYELNQKPYLENVMAKEYINNFIFIPNTQHLEDAIL